jgi:hypothetical protein
MWAKASRSEEVADLRSLAPRGARGAASATLGAGPLRVEDPCSSSPSCSSSSSESSSSSSESGGRPRRQHKTEHAARLMVWGCGVLLT